MSDAPHWAAYNPRTGRLYLQIDDRASLNVLAPRMWPDTPETRSTITELIRNRLLQEWPDLRFTVDVT
jgi:hypothetical protein